MSQKSENHSGGWFIDLVSNIGLGIEPFLLSFGSFRTGVLTNFLNEQEKEHQQLFSGLTAVETNPEEIPEFGSYAEDFPGLRVPYQP